MSVCTFIASNCPMKEVASEKEYPIEINLDNGTIDDGGADDNYFLLPFNDVSDYTDMKYGVYIEWNYTDGRAEQILKYMRAALEETEQIELWHVWLMDYYEYEDSPVIHKRTISIEDGLKAGHGVPADDAVFLGYKAVNSWDGAHPMTEFVIMSWGSTYYGCYYSPDDVPLAFQNTATEIMSKGNDCWEWSAEGDNQGETYKIMDYWYFFKALF